MCGVAGVLGAGHVEQHRLLAMCGAMHHLGPDDEGVWTDREAGIGLAHARLSIIDLSPAGHQPMHSASGRFVFAFNGEIYNHLEMRAQLEREGAAPGWRGHSDSETLLAGFEAWGIVRTIQRTVGMFAIAVWDRRDRRLTLVRDRLGEKPLYYGWSGGAFLFGSDLRALKAHPSFRGEIDRRALTLYLRHNYIPAPYSIYQGVMKLPPATLLTVAAERGEPKLEPYWDLESVIAAGQSNLFEGTPTEAVQGLEERLRSAVNGQMTASDVPVGAFLSGGIDSSTTVALMQAQAAAPVRTFTIGFHESSFDEAVHARKVAEHLGTDHTELYVTPQQALDIVPQLPSIYSEPFADSSQIPTFLVSKLARSQVTVALSGDGGDELFGGYDRYLLGERLWRKLSLLPNPVRRLARRTAARISPERWNTALAMLRPALPSGLARVNLGHKIGRAGELLDASSRTELYRLLVSGWGEPSEVVVGGAEPPTVLSRGIGHGDRLAFTHLMMALDLQSYLPDDILAKVDRAAMGVSLETRVPLLDHRVVEFSWCLPLSIKVRGGTSKWPLRQILHKYVPSALVDRPKMGFGVPLHSWLCGPLRDWAEDLLSESRLRREGYFNPKPIRDKWAEHLSGARNWQYHLWDILMFEAWLAQQ